MDGIQYVNHDDMEWRPCCELNDSCARRLTDLAPTLKRLRLGGSYRSYWYDGIRNPQGYLCEYKMLEVLRIECRTEHFMGSEGGEVASSLPSTLRCLSLSGCRDRFLVDVGRGLVERVKGGDLPQFRSLHIIINKGNAVERSSEELKIRTQLEELGVELKFYEQDIRHGVEFAGMEDEGWTVQEKIGGSLDFQFSSKETSS